MELTKENYHSLEASKYYMSRGQFNDFLECEAKAMAILNGEWKEEETTALLVGRYVHAWNEGTLEELKDSCPQMFKKDGSLKAEFVQAEKMIETLQNDPLVMHTLTGEKERIFTAKLFGVPWKVMIDVHVPGKRNVDIKTTKSIRGYHWVEALNGKVSFIEEYHYLRQAALYSEIERIANGREEGDWLPFYSVVVSKEKVPDKEIIEFTDPDRFRYELDIVKECMPRIIAVKTLQTEPQRCNKCAYCISTKKLTRALHFTEI